MAVTHGKHWVDLYQGQDGCSLCVNEKLNLVRAINLVILQIISLRIGSEGTMCKPSSLFMPLNLDVHEEEKPCVAVTFL